MVYCVDKDMWSSLVSLWGYLKEETGNDFEKCLARKKGIVLNGGPGVSLFGNDFKTMGIKNKPCYISNILKYDTSEYYVFDADVIQGFFNGYSTSEGYVFSKIYLSQLLEYNYNMVSACTSCFLEVTYNKSIDLYSIYVNCYFSLFKYLDDVFYRNGDNQWGNIFELSDSVKKDLRIGKNAYSECVSVIYKEGDRLVLKYIESVLEVVYCKEGDGTEDVFFKNVRNIMECDRVFILRDISTASNYTHHVTKNGSKDLIIY